MSIVSTIQPKPATLSTATKKAFNAVPLADILHGAIYREGVTDLTSVKPSDIRMNNASALTALGGRMSPQSFILGLVFAAVRYAHGQQLDGTTLPSGSLTAINASLSLIKKGAGINALSLETATKAGIDALLALPAPIAAKKTTPAAIVAPVAPAAPAAPAAPHWSAMLGPINRDADSFAAEIAANSALDAANEARAAKESERTANAAKYEQDAETSAKAIVASVTSRRDAQEIARTIAESLGFRLVRIAKKSA